MSTQAKSRHAALLDALDDATPMAAGAAAAQGKASPDASVPALSTAGSLLREELHAERERANSLQHEVEALRSAPAERKIPAQLIRHGKFRDRHELGFKDAKYEELKASILHEQGNHVAILVRPLLESDAQGHEYEVVWGHRRHQACLELGFEVNAIVRELSDREAVVLMTLENKLREGLSQYELARTYKAWLDEELFPNQQAVAEREGLNQATISRIMSINELPAAIVDRIDDPRTIAGKWAAKVLRLISADGEGVAARLAAMVRKRTPAALMKVIEPPQSMEPREVTVGDRPIFQAVPSKKRGEEVSWSTIKLYTNLDEDKLKKLAAFIAKL